MPTSYRGMGRLAGCNDRAGHRWCGVQKTWAEPRARPEKRAARKGAQGRGVWLTTAPAAALLAKGRRHPHERRRLGARPYAMTQSGLFQVVLAYWEAPMPVWRRSARWQM